MRVSQIWPNQPVDYRLHIFVRLPIITEAGEQSLLFLRTTISDDGAFFSPAVHFNWFPTLRFLALILSRFRIPRRSRCLLAPQSANAMLPPPAMITSSSSNEFNASSVPAISGMQIMLDPLHMMATHGLSEYWSPRSDTVIQLYNILRQKKLVQARLALADIFAHS